MMKLSRKAELFLELSGWIAGQGRDVSQTLDVLEKEGCVMNKHAIEFLEQFEGVKGKHPVCKAIQTIMHFNAVAAAEVGMYWVEIYEKWVGESLVVVGGAYSGHVTLMISQSGRMFGGYDSEFWLVGDSYVDGLNKLCN
jgi:hypothetical protein